ncbi:murein L,D-transpeptidase catalytic domain-containing protein [Hymenobacter rubripertinctus]|nr:murein L,D-transpeptidase catalytic domain family protein [Hymenobacter rubripertinctus]
MSALRSVSRPRRRQHRLLPLLAAAALAVVLGGALLEVYPAWCYRLLYFTGVPAGADRLAAARAMTRRNPLFNARHAVLIDMDRASSEPRLAVYDLRKGRPLLRTRVMHGQGSGGKFARAFSNWEGSKRTALGRYVVVRAYRGRFGRAYRLAGLDATNDNAITRSIVLHSSGSVRAGRIGRSDGCPAVSAEALARMRPWLKPGTLLWIYR